MTTKRQRAIAKREKRRPARERRKARERREYNAEVRASRVGEQSLDLLGVAIALGIAAQRRKRRPFQSQT